MAVLGQGILYDPLTGNIVYKGQFADGQYSGEGKLYDPVTGNHFRWDLKKVNTQV